MKLGLKPITITVTPQMEAMFKTAKVVDFTVDKVGYKVDLKDFLGS